VEQEAGDSRLSRTLELTAAELQVKFEKVRYAFEHNGLVGQEGEKIVAKFLRERLPGSIGVTTGEVLDVEGGRSRQTDVVLLTRCERPCFSPGRRRTPTLCQPRGF